MSEPVGYGDECEVGAVGEGCFFVGVVPAASVSADGCRVAAELWAVVALCFPSVASGVVVVGAVAGEWPAVVEGPYYGASPLF